jgi:mannose-1-phosphate guanylyltransferase
VLDRFIEKPNTTTARSLRSSGALWNTFLLAGPAVGLWSLVERHLPTHARALGDLDCLSFAPGAPDLDLVFDRLAPADFSRDVLQHASDLTVVAMTDSGWDDWGTPDRVLRSLGATRARALREQLARVPCRCDERATSSADGHAGARQ